MTYPQTSAEKATLLGQEYWRLFTELESSGDIFEAPVSARAVVIGPQSDISRVNLTHYDQQSPNLASTVLVSIDKPLVGRVDALFSTPFQSGDRARVQVSTEDLLPPPGYLPQTASLADIIEIIQPRIDLYYYLDEEPGFIPQRSDRVHLFEQLPFLGSSALGVYYVIPFYGRRFVELTIKQLGLINQPAFDVTLYGVNFSNIVADASLADDGHQQEILGVVNFAGAPPAGGTVQSITVSNRAWDALVIRIEPLNPFPSAQAVVTHVVVSDTP